MSAEFTLNELKLAVIEKDIEKLKELSFKTPVFSSIEEAEEMNGYIKKATEILITEKNKLSKEMQKIKKLQKFQSIEKNSGFDFKG